MPRHRKHKRNTRKLKRLRGGAMPDDARTILFVNTTQIPMRIQISPMGELNRYHYFSRPSASIQVINPGQQLLLNDLDIDYNISISPFDPHFFSRTLPLNMITNDTRLARFNRAKIIITNIDLIGNPLPGKMPQIGLEIQQGIRPFRIGAGDRFTIEPVHRLHPEDEDFYVSGVEKDSNMMSPYYGEPTRLLSREAEDSVVAHVAAHAAAQAANIRARTSAARRLQRMTRNKKRQTASQSKASQSKASKSKGPKKK